LLFSFVHQELDQRFLLTEGLTSLVI